MQHLYKCGIIGYSRLDNNFIKDKLAYDMYPHPKLELNSEFFSEVIGDDVKINKKNSLLFLTILRVMSAANIENYAEFIDEFFDDELNYKDKNTEDLAQSIMKSLSSFLESNQIGQEEICVLYGNIFNISKARSYSHYKTDSVSFYPDSLTRINKLIPYEIDSSTLDEDLNIETDYYDKLKIRGSLSDILNEYRQRKDIEFETATKIYNKLDNIHQTIKEKL